MFKRLLLIFCLLSANSVYANSYGLYDFDNVRYEHSRNTTDVRSIASITKLFTAYAVVMSQVDLNEKIKVQGKSGGRFARGAYLERNELMRAMLMSSDNLAAESLARSHPGGYEQFIKDVNLRISDMGLKNTVIVDSTGLLAGNKSTVDDLRDFLFKLRQYPLIQQLSSEKFHTYEYHKGKQVVKVNLKNTNPQLWTYDNIILTKTGFTSAAGRCLAMLVEKDGVLYALVTLGNRNVEQRSRVITGMFIDHIYSK